jgi:hypothetical protein
MDGPIELKTTRDNEQVEMASAPPLAEPTKAEMYLEDDPHRAALEDNPEIPEPMTVIKLVAIAVRAFY